MLKTFNEWSYTGYQIRKYSKAVSFNENGKALFSPDQVKKKRYYSSPDRDEDMDNPDYGDYELSFGREW
jgi:hypothetical protein